MTLFRTGSAALLCAALLAGCQPDEPMAEDAAAEEDSAPVPVEVGLPIRGDIYATYSGTAPIEAFAEADVIAKVDGEVRELHVEEGDIVQEGDVLTTLDGDRLRLEVNESKARLQKLQREFDRNRELQAKGLISEGDFEKIQYELEALEASHNLTSLELNYTKIRATISGIVSERYIKLGNTIKAGDPVYRITRLDPLVAYMHVPEREFKRIQPGQAAHISVDALSGPPIVAAVTRVSPIVDPATGTFKIAIEIHDDAQRIKPGMFGRVNVIYDTHENALQIPRSAIIDRAGDLSVFVVDDGVGRKRAVETGFSSGGMVEVTAGLADGEKVITVGHVGLKDESAVVVINQPDTAAD